MNIKLTIAYIGTRYHGFQVQKNAIAVCTVLQDAIEKIYGERLAIIGCSRTDAGVHANGYVANYHAEKYIKPWQIAGALNQFLPGDIRVMTSEEVSEDFHARYHAVAKRYVYRICNGRVQNPFSSKYVAHYPEPLNAEDMMFAAPAYIGKHDFRSFCGKSPEGIPADTVRTVYDSRVWTEGEVINFSVVADGFLYKMVRIMVGTLIEIGAGRLPKNCIPTLIETKDRGHRGTTAKSKGLTLDTVFYEVIPEKFLDISNSM